MADPKLPREVQDSLAELHNHYEIEQSIDKGANGYVFFARNRVSDQQLVIKFYAGEPGDSRHNEPRLLAQVRSANVLRVLEARIISDLWAFFITPRCEGDLNDFIASRPSAHDAVDVALGVCAGVSALHGQGMLHRDIKPANIVMDGNVPLIADFGSVRQLAGTGDSVVASRHTVLFRPPESFGEGVYSAKGDIYQIGVITYQLLGGKLSDDLESYFTKRDQLGFADVTGDYERSVFVDNVIRRRAEAGNLLDLTSLPPWVNGTTKRVIRRMTSPDPAERMATLAEAAADLTRCRSALVNWEPLGQGAKLDLPNFSIELRPTGIPDQLAAFRVQRGEAKRARGVAMGPLNSLVAHFSNEVRTQQVSCYRRDRSTNSRSDERSCDSCRMADWISRDSS